MPGRYTPPKSEQERLIALENGMLVERDVLNVVEKIRAHDPNLRVKYLDPERVESMFDAPYVVTEMCPDGIERVVCQVWKLDDEVYQRIVMADTYRIDIQAEIDKKNAAAKKEEQRLEREKNDALVEMVTDVLKSPKDTYTATNPVTGKDHKFTATKQSA